MKEQLRAYVRTALAEGHSEDAIRKILLAHGYKNNDIDRAFGRVRSQTPLIIVGASLVLGLLFDYLFYDKTLGVSFPLYIGFIIAGLFLIASYSKRYIPKQALWLVAPLGFFSLMVFVRASELLTFLNVIASFSLLFFIAQVLFGKDIKRYLLQDYFKTLLLPFKFCVPFTRIVLDLFASHGVVRHPHTFSQVIKGIGLTVPFLIIFLLLFSSADL